MKYNLDIETYSVMKLNHINMHKVSDIVKASFYTRSSYHDMVRTFRQCELHALNSQLSSRLRYDLFHSVLDLCVWVETDEI